jgi:hypothetical protein
MSDHKRLLDNTQHTQETDIHAPGGVRTSNPSNQEAARPRLTHCNHWDRLYFDILSHFTARILQ